MVVCITGIAAVFPGRFDTLGMTFNLEFFGRVEERFNNDVANVLAGIRVGLGSVGRVKETKTGTAGRQFCWADSFVTSRLTGGRGDEIIGNFLFHF